jgi:hypothetical protein
MVNMYFSSTQSIAWPRKKSVLRFLTTMLPTDHLFDIPAGKQGDRKPAARFEPVVNVVKVLQARQGVFITPVLYLIFPPSAR